MSKTSQYAVLRARKMKKELSISAIKDGSVIDHIPSNATLKVVDILDLKGIRGMISIATNLTSKTMGKKGIIKISGKDLTKEEVDKIINYFSAQTKIPLVGGTFKAAFRNLIITAVISDFLGSRFVIEKRSPFQTLPPLA